MRQSSTPSAAKNNWLKENKLHGTEAFHCALYQSHPEDRKFQVLPHWHDELEIIYLAEGSFYVEINMEPFEVLEECFFLINSGELHSLKGREACREYAIVFCPEILSFDAHDEAQSQFIWPLINGSLLLPRVIASSDQLFEPVRREYMQALELVCQKEGGTPDPKVGACIGAAAQLSLKAALLKIFALLCSADRMGMEGGADARVEAVKSVLSYVQKHYRERLFLADLASHVNLNEQYFCRFFKRALGKSPMEYVNEYRIHKAMDLLEHTGMPVMEVCLDTGFRNLGNFLREFRKHTSMTPLQYRKYARGYRPGRG